MVVRTISYFNNSTILRISGDIFDAVWINIGTKSEVDTGLRWAVPEIFKDMSVKLKISYVVESYCNFKQTNFAIYIDTNRKAPTTEGAEHKIYQKIYNNWKWELSNYKFTTRGIDTLSIALSARRGGSAKKLDNLTKNGVN